MITKIDIKLGARIRFTKHYSINPKLRLPYHTCDAVPSCDSIKRGIIVGSRNYIMDSYKREYIGYEEGSTITGKVRRMIVVAYDINKKHILVDPQDAELEEIN